MYYVGHQNENIKQQHRIGSIKTGELSECQPVRAFIDNFWMDF